jgi:hypothetical protein
MPMSCPYRNLAIGEGFCKEVPCTCSWQNKRRKSTGFSPYFYGENPVQIRGFSRCGAENGFVALRAHNRYLLLLHETKRKNQRIEGMDSPLLSSFPDVLSVWFY